VWGKANGGALAVLEVVTEVDAGSPLWPNHTDQGARNSNDLGQAIVPVNITVAKHSGVVKVLQTGQCFSMST